MKWNALQQYYPSTTNAAMLDTFIPEISKRKLSDGPSTNLKKFMTTSIALDEQLQRTDVSFFSYLNFLIYVFVVIMILFISNNIIAWLDIQRRKGLCKNSV